MFPVCLFLVDLCFHTLQSFTCLMFGWCVWPLNHCLTGSGQARRGRDQPRADQGDVDEREGEGGGGGREQAAQGRRGWLRKFSFFLLISFRSEIILKDTRSAALWQETKRLVYRVSMVGRGYILLTLFQSFIIPYAPSAEAESGRQWYNKVQVSNT